EILRGAFVVRFPVRRLPLSGVTAFLEHFRHWRSEFAGTCDDSMMGRQDYKARWQLLLTTVQ
ncbi:hypothetical protein ACLHZN_27785, partial [Escherichia coli]